MQDGKIRYLEKFTLAMLCLKVRVELVITMSAGNEFQMGTTRLTKKNFLVLDFARGIESLRWWPRENLNEGS